MPFPALRTARALLGAALSCAALTAAPAAAQRLTAAHPTAARSTPTQAAAARNAPAVRAALDTVAMLAPVRAFIDAFNRGAPSAPPDAFTTDVIITDDLPPFRWTGADALAQWWTALFGTTPAQRGDFARMQRRLLLGPARHLFVAGDDAYVTLPVTMTAVDTRHGRPLTVAGDLALTLRRVDGRWRLSSHAWVRRETAS